MMTIRCLATWALVAIIWTVTVGSARVSQGPELLFPGPNWSDADSASAGAGWLGLRHESGRSELVSVKVLVTKNDPREHRPLLVTIGEGFEPRFLVRGVSGLYPGPVHTVFDGLASLRGGMHFNRGPARAWTAEELSIRFGTSPKEPRIERLVLSGV